MTPLTSGLYWVSVRRDSRAQQRSCARQQHSCQKAESDVCQSVMTRLSDDPISVHLTCEK